MFGLKLGKSIGVKAENFYALIDEAKSLGFDSVDVDYCACGFFFGEDDVTESKKRMQYVVDSGLYFNGVHIPYGTEWDISVKDEESRRSVVENVKRLISICDPFQPFCYILHGSFEPIMDCDRKAQLNSFIRSANELYAYTQTPIAMENLPRSCLLNTSEEILKVQKKVRSLRLCVDLNHFLRELTEEAVQILAPYAITLHVSDHDYANERHWLPGAGKIDWNKTLAALEAAGYNGAFNYEVNATLQEVKENFDRLMEEYEGYKQSK